MGRRWIPTAKRLLPGTTKLRTPWLVGLVQQPATRRVLALALALGLLRLSGGVALAAPALLEAVGGDGSLLATVTGWVAALKPLARLAALAGLSGYATGYFLIPWLPGWSQQHRDWVRGAGLVLLLLFFGPAIIESVLPAA